MRFVATDRFIELQATGKLPSPKGIALSIIRLLQRDDYRVSDLAQLVQSDPAISGRILYFSNAAAFGRSRPIISLQRAIVALGSFRVRDLVIGLSVMHNHRSGQCAEFDYEKFWGHSLATGIASQELARYAQIASEEIFTIGLLSRVGELALATLFPDEYAGILIKTRENDLDISELEHERFKMDHHELTASLLCEWGLPEVLIQAAFHFENPDAAGFSDGSRAQTLTYSLSFANALAHLCMVNEASRWSLLPGLLARAARLGIGGEALNDLADRVVACWREWGATLHVRTQDIPPFAEILAATPSVHRMGTVPPSEDRRSRASGLNIQLIGIPTEELTPIMQLVESLGHQPVLIDESPKNLALALQNPAQIIIADMSMPGALKPAHFCQRLHQTEDGRNCYLLFLASPEQENQTLEVIDAGANDILIKPVNEQALRVHLSTAVKMLVLREQIHRERLGIMRSTDEFAITQKRLLQDALTDTLTQLPNRRKGMDFLASELLFTQSSGAPLACLMLDIDHFKRINDQFGHAAGDIVLRQLADTLKSTSRTEDLVFRYGGEEFVAILTNTPLRIAQQIAERIRSQVEKTPFKWKTQRIPVTLSIGVAASTGKEQDGLALIQAADAALYQAKESGRNRVVAAS